MNNTFQQDLQKGSAIEEKALTMIRKKYPSASLVHKFKGYDIWIPETHSSVEVKYDPMSNETGNILVEIEMYGKPSALMATTSTWWLFYDDIQWIWIMPREIIRCILLNRLTYKSFVGKGDTEEKKAFLIPKMDLMEFASAIQSKEKQ